MPARLVGTPAWQGNVSHGNHNWVEVKPPRAPLCAPHPCSQLLTSRFSAVFTHSPPSFSAVFPTPGRQVWVGGTTDSGDGWAFIEGAPAGGGETLTNPCDKWFCNAGHFNHR